MAYAQARSCNDALILGATEGGEKQLRPNRGGVVTSPPNTVAGATPMKETLCCGAGH